MDYFYKLLLSVIVFLALAHNACSYINYLDKEKGDECIGVFNNVFLQGECKLLQDCPIILNNFKRGIYSHSICGYDNFKQIGCCPKLKPNGDVYLVNQNEQKIEFIESSGFNVYDLEEGDKCTIIENNIGIPGDCKLILDCPTLLRNIQHKIYNHTICGYKHEFQIGCCPFNNQNGDFAAIESYKYKDDAKNFNNGMECKVEGANEIGVIKFLEDCPDFQYSKKHKLSYFNFCESDICKDLVCCPNKNINRAQKVCNYVDNPIDEISLRLHQNLPCTVRELNLTGVIQTKCDFVEQNPHLKTKLNSICKHEVCHDWYCCPIEKPEERHCTKKSKVSPYVEFVGPKCIDSKTGRHGRCRQSENCHVKRKDLDECGSNCCEKFYCCPDEDISNQRIFELRCSEYKNHFFKKHIEIPLTFKKNVDCVDSNYKNTDITVRKYPHTAELGYFNTDSTISWRCSGSLISDRFVITAGHCLIMDVGESVKIVRLGSPNCREDFGVSELIAHPEHNKNSLYHDIGLIKLNRNVAFSHHIRPVCLSGGPELPKHIFTLKYDTNSQAGLENIKLEHVDHELLAYQECKPSYNMCSSEEFNVSTQICTIYKDVTRTEWSKNFGGPLLSFHDDVDHSHNFYKIYGVQSSETCEFAPKLQIFTKIFPHINWIEKILWQQ